MRKELPAKYYLSHFNELVTYLFEVCEPLLSDAQLTLLKRLQQLPENELCLLVRFISRKTPYLDVHQLNYQEIEDIQSVALELKEKKLLRGVVQKDLRTFFGCLTKPHLIQLAEASLITELPSKTAKKADWINALLGAMPVAQLHQQSHFSGYLTLTFQADVDYFLFLYFAKPGFSLAQFSMRDLGVMNTRSAVKHYHAHFEQRAEAQSAFFYTTALAELKEITKDELFAQAENLLAQKNPEAVGHYATSAFAKYAYTLAKKLGPTSAHYIRLLAVSEHPQALEALIRHHYKMGAIEVAKQQLEQILQGEYDETLMIFAEDFYQRKFNKKRTSLLTDMLRKSAPAIKVDEAYKGQTEAGVVDYYQRHGVAAYHVENKIWLTLFGLTFWQELFNHPNSSVANGFSRTPAVLKDNQFYAELGHDIEARLASFTSAKAWSAWLLKQMIENYGEPNRLFYWHEQLLEPVECLLSHSNIDTLKQVLRLMSQDFNSMRSGFPDLMVVAPESGIRFEEIKAPGDSLSRSQLVSIAKLLTCNIATKIQTVEWQITPEQPYVIVDIETTGGNKEVDRITEIAMVKVVNGEVVDKWQSLVDPMRRIPARITELTGISQAMVNGAPRFSEVMDQVLDFSQGAIFVAHNVNFDYGFIRQECIRAGGEFCRAKLCTVQLARKYIPGLKSYALGALSQALGVDLVNHHRAMDDALAATEIFLQINAIRQEQ
ncbi:DNA polymerase III subunit epsilon [Pseudoalteromonas piscicida]|uniref:DNA polymerase III subunit epsilon n=1 Tax=Pseudoalteromonas piscicida TaxID=43662 RepID=A0A2A5JPF1_PSEO7|nr:DNA polymerase III subunit epsilon [Pseudoalteromonas piscicida]